MSKIIMLQESADPATPVAGHFVFYAKPDGLYIKDSTGAIRAVFMDGAVGPGSAVNNNIVLFDGMTGTLIKDSGLATSAFAVAARGVTNGDSHDHSGGDGAQIAYSSLSGTPSLPSFPSGAVVGTSDTQTLTAKRITQRVNTVSSSATPSINVDTTDMFTITALAAAITSMTSGLSGTPTGGQKLIIRIKDDGTPRAIAWGASFVARGGTLPVTTVAGKYVYVGLIWNEVGTWDCVAVSQEA